MTEQVCTCGHAAGEHDLIDHDENAPLSYKKWRHDGKLDSLDVRDLLREALKESEPA